MGKRRTGLNPAAYLGVEAPTPPQFEDNPRAPTSNDYYNFNVGTIWLNTSSAVPTASDVWFLAAKKNKVATWIRLAGEDDISTITGDSGGAVPSDSMRNINVLSAITGLTVDGDIPTNTLTLNSSGGGPLFQTLTGDSGGAVPPDGTGTINILSAITGLTVDGDIPTNTLTLNASGGGGIVQTLTGNSGGAISPDGSGNIDIITDNATVTFAGSGNQLLQDFGITNLALGDSLTNVTTGVDNTSLGVGSLTALTEGSNNTVVGDNAATSLTTGAANIILGRNSGNNYTGAESSNIILGNTGTVADSNVVRIGTDGAGAGQQDAAYMAGVYGRTTAADRQLMFMDSTTKMGTDDLSADSWTPTLAFGGASTGIVYTDQEGNYQAIGNLVFYSASIVISNKGTATGIATIGGLPFASAGVLNTQMGVFSTSGITFPAGRTYLWCTNQIGTTTFRITSGGSGVLLASLTHANFSNNVALTISGFYFRA